MPATAASGPKAELLGVVYAYEADTFLKSYLDLIR